MAFSNSLLAIKPRQSERKIPMDSLVSHLLDLEKRILYLQEVKASSAWAQLDRYLFRIRQLKDFFPDGTSPAKVKVELRKLADSINFLEQRCEDHLTAMDRVRIARSPARFTFHDLLEGLYDDCEEIQEENSIGLISAKAILYRQSGNAQRREPVMVLGHSPNEKTQHFKSISAVKDSLFHKAISYAEQQNIPVHLFIFAPAAHQPREKSKELQQAGHTLLSLAKATVPLIAVISSGESTRAESIALADSRLMLSHGYYSLISPEYAAMTEGKLQDYSEIPVEILELCAERLQLTARDNLRLGIIDRIVDEPILGARRNSHDFFQNLRQEIIAETDRVILQNKDIPTRLTFALPRPKKSQIRRNESSAPLPWHLSGEEQKRLLAHRTKKYLAKGNNGYTSGSEKTELVMQLAGFDSKDLQRIPAFEVLENKSLGMGQALAKITTKSSGFLEKMSKPLAEVKKLLQKKSPKQQLLLSYTEPAQNDPNERPYSRIPCSLEFEDRRITCPNSVHRGCESLWLPDLYRKSAGVCSNCGYHFFLSSEWYLKYFFDRQSIEEFSTKVTAINPLNYTGFSKKLHEVQNRTGYAAGNMTFKAKLNKTEIMVSMLFAEFCDGTLGTAEGEKFCRACKMAEQKHLPLLALVHSTTGLRLQEGALALSQLSKCTVALRQYLSTGGRFIALYDNQAFGSPVASFLSQAPLRYAIKSTLIGLTSPHLCQDKLQGFPACFDTESALERNLVQEIWDRRDLKDNLSRILKHRTTLV